MFNLFFNRVCRYCFTRWFLLIPIELFSHSVWGQPGNLKFTHYTINEGLSEGTVSSIAQDQQGFMWFGTLDGLDRFDGYEFTVFRHDPFDSTSLSDNSITKLFVDSHGQLWVGTLHGGLNLFNSSNNCFIHFLNPLPRRGGEKGDYIRAIAEDSRGHLWIGTFGYGIYELVFGQKGKDGLYLPEKIRHYSTRSESKNGLNNNFISCIFCDAEDRLWISTGGDHPVQMAKLGNNEIYFSTPLFIEMKPKAMIRDQTVRYYMKQAVFSKQKKPYPYLVYDIYEDASHRLWFTGNGGVYFLRNNSDTLINIVPSLRPKTVEDVTLSVMQGGDHDSTFWFGTWGGLGIFNAKNLTLRFIRHKAGDNTGLPKGVISCIYRDRSGCIWLGANGYGICKYSYKSSLFKHPVYHSAHKDASSENITVLSIMDTKNYLLLGTFDSLWKVNKNTGIMTHVSGTASTRDICAADSGKVWLGGTYGLALYDPGTGKMVVYSPEIKLNGKEDDRVIKIFNGGPGDMWVLTTMAFCQFNVETKTFTKYFYRNDYLNHIYFFSGDIYQDPKGNFWLGTETGLLYFNTKKKTFQRYLNNPKDTASLSFNQVECIQPDPALPEEYLWIGTAGGGLDKFNLITKKFTRFTIKNGLPNNFINGILADNKGNLWISTNNGISRFNPQDNTFHNYDVRDGLTSNAFNPGAYYRSPEGKFFFGGVRGLNTFYPDHMVNSNYRPPIAFTDFRLFNRPALVGRDGSPLKRSLRKTRSITLHYSDNLISFRVAALDYTEPDKNQYAYRLKGLNNQWIYLGNERLITLGNLAPGHYVLEVKGTNSDGIWNQKTASMELRILPPWWKTWWAYLAYVAITVALVILIRKEGMTRIKLRNNLQLERFKSEKLKEVDHLKSRFFANISHEFRTPLTLIIGPLQDMMQGGSSEKFKDIIPAMYRNSQRLLELINQLLDLSKLDAGHYPINTTGTNIVPFVKQVTSIFSTVAGQKNILLSIQTEDRLMRKLHGGESCFYFDEDVVEKVLTNLISNALKFTPSGGEVKVSMELAEKGPLCLMLKVSDNGETIPEEKLPFIFDRFYQADDSSKKKFEGSGIGLAVVKELMELHGGKVVAESSSGKGTVFSCFFPFNKRVVAGDSVPAEGRFDKKRVAPGELPAPRREKASLNDKPLILIIEDNPDMRKYIGDKLSDDYRIKECGDGKEGLTAAFKEIPDLVISDVMMPEMDGFELSRTLKTDERTSHIPIIFLTAKADDADKMLGLEIGADAYMIKPFNSRELQIRVTNLIEIRNTMRAKFSKKSAVKPTEVTVSSFDKAFIAKLKSITEANISNADFKVDDLSREMGMSISQLNRKLKAIINQTSSQYITSIRMQKAMDLLKNNSGNITEVSWNTGYEDPGYFSKVFKAYYGFLPSDRGEILAF